MGGYALIENASLAARNTLRVDARARLLAEIRDAAKLPELLDFPAVRSGRLLVLGEGSNVLFTGDFDGTVLAMATRGVQVESDGDGARIAVAAGERWDDFVRWTLGQGYAGLENLILIPGTVGAAPIQNIGAYGCEVAEFIDSVEAWDTHERQVATLDRAACAFAYRDSLFKHEPGRYVVTAVRFVLPRSRPLRTDYAGIDEELARMGVDRPAPFHVAEAVMRLRLRKLPDPAVIGNAGSFFKNPIVDAALANALQREHPGLAAWPQPDGRSKLSAAWLIEKAGFKGLREGDAGISNRHALVLVNHGHATGPQLWALAQQVMHGVRERFGVQLEPEPVVIGAR
ncbi:MULTISPECIES: UDP-N-acetylmuramate dehydrogenase [Rhodanobacter]|uniref:UDP-N-acetylmuramate dehydrogenase n=1 Tax=Rhodanobacter TaxID=75309 RepID=UPI000416BE0B|nr:MULTISPECIES: UDP-N-acetylmuramate dehydrogenase [Rhodanobacter]KZC18879.1 UDP-N-acetylenolpyruvoylglucosamine reductase [Rhodanobacter denitrificans]UJJ52883.1 UDP-N-acetylmuramate dehydrogenase [Rhodanobacter denitrificans]UJJ60363.1 UDP-N-acetylmuramate dehydrogenase [Rhodanobacter denitrificans]UJM95637.1 UDP-N-acetylmuramate dehydrogenase [Rhodanobacter denitrificans]UJM99166.1 UDP-N-acetylmuramate dehydrogenase [Rhodanobacter denitrificans]